MNNKAYFAAIVFVVAFAGFYGVDKFTNKVDGCKDNCCPVPNLSNDNSKQIDSIPQPYKPYTPPVAPAETKPAPQAQKPKSDGPYVWSITGRINQQKSSPVQPQQPPCNGPT